MSELVITEENFETALGTDKDVLVDFFADWCGPCRMLSPIIEEIADERAQTLVVGKVNVDDQPNLAARFGISSIPTVIFFRNGKEADRFVGYRPKDAVEELLG